MFAPQLHGRGEHCSPASETNDFRSNNGYKPKKSQYKMRSPNCIQTDNSVPIRRASNARPYDHMGYFAEIIRLCTIRSISILSRHRISLKRKCSHPYKAFCRAFSRKSGGSRCCEGKRTREVCTNLKKRRFFPKSERRRTSCAPVEALRKKER